MTVAETTDNEFVEWQVMFFMFSMDALITPFSASNDPSRL